MKIVILSFYSGKVERGVENFTKELSYRLGKHHQVSVYQSGKINNSKLSKTVVLPVAFSLERKTNKWLRKFYLDYYSLKILFFTLKTFRYLIKEKPDILMPTNNGWQSLLCKIYSLIFRVSLVFTGHAGPGWDDFVNLKLRPDLFICFSASQASWARRVNKDVNLEIIPHGVDLKKFNPSVKPVKIELAKPIILCVSALDEYKRVDLVVKAFSFIKRGSLLLITQGTKKQKDKIKALGDKILGKRFKQISVSYNHLPLFYTACDLFTLVSTFREAFGIVYLEAMASGLPIVAPDDDLRREIIGQAGLFVKEPIDSQKLASAIQKALTLSWDDKPRRQAEKFSWEKIAKKYEEVFLEVVKE